MPPEQYIAIGRKGTDITDLVELDPSLHEGENSVPAPGGEKTKAIWGKFRAWVAHSNIKGEKFELWRVAEAVARGRVVHIPHLRWRMDHDQSIREGEAFFKPGWNQQSGQPELTAVREVNGRCGRVRFEPHRVKERRGDDVGHFLFDSPAARAALAAPQKAWTRQELLIVLNVYHKLPFAELGEKQPVIVTLAGKLGRTSRSILLKLQDFALLDTSLGSRRLTIAQNPGAQEREVWKEFQANPNEVIPESEELLCQEFGADENSALEISLTDGIQIRPQPQGPTEVQAMGKQRRGQDYFRDLVINNARGRCGVTGLALRELLVASHILPWNTYPEHRTDVRNGLCLSRLFDTAFDRHLITFDSRLRLELSPRLSAELEKHKELVEQFGRYVGEELRLPEGAARPNPAFMAEHAALTRCKT